MTPTLHYCYLVYISSLQCNEHCFLIALLKYIQNIHMVYVQGHSAQNEEDLHKEV